MKHRIIFETGLQPRPEPHEISAAVILAEYFGGDVTFIRRSPNSKTADFKINGKIWELKSPIGNGKRTMQNNLRKADSQAVNIILDLRRCKMHSSRAMSKIKFELSRANRITHLIAIQKNETIVALK